jgi:hypothetical protein
MKKIRIKKNKYVEFFELPSGHYYCLNPLNREFTVVNRKLKLLVNKLVSWSELEEILTPLRKSSCGKLLREKIKELLEKNILIRESEKEKENLPADFVIVGVTNDFSKLSLEVFSILKHCSTIVTLNNLYKGYLSRINSKIVDLSEVFHLEDSSAYQKDPCLRVAERYMKIAAKLKDCVFVTENHPTVGESIPFFIYKIAQFRKKTVQIYESLSFLDSFFAGLPFDPLDNGLTIVRANLLSGINSSNFPLLICLIGYEVMGPKWNTKKEKREIFSQSLSNIKKELLRIGYAPNHKCSFFSQNNRTTIDLSVKDLEKCCDYYVGKGISLFVPPKKGD